MFYAVVNTFIYIQVVSSGAVKKKPKQGIPGQNHRPWTKGWQILLHKDLPGRYWSTGSEKYRYLLSLML